MIHFSAQSNQELVDYLKQQGVLKSPAVISAFEQVDRADFVSDKSTDVYADHPLSIGEGQTISQPYTVAFMIELLQPSRGQKILDIGSGSGWTTALLAKSVAGKGQVIGLEVVQDLVKFGQKNLAKYKLPQAEIRRAGEELGLPREAPFDRILVSAAARELPQSLIDQLKPDGVLVIPVQNSIWRLTKTKSGEVDKEEIPGFVFVPLID